MGSSRIDAVRQRLALKYFNEGPNIVRRSDTRATFLTPEGNYVGKANPFNSRNMENYSHSQYIEDIKDPNPGNYPNMGDYTDNPRVLDYMDREDMIRVNSYSAGTDVEVLNEPDPNQIKAIRKIFQEDATPRDRRGYANMTNHTKVSVWGMGDDGIFQKTNVTNYKDFRKVLKTNEWKGSLDPNMQSQIREHWLQQLSDVKYEEQAEDLHVNRLGRNAKSARIQTARQRLADIFDVIEGGGKIKPTKYLPSGMDEQAFRTKTTPENFLDLSAQGWEVTEESNTNIEPLSKQTKSKVDKALSRPERLQREIFRGDEKGSVEYIRRQLRRGDPIQTPFLDVYADKPEKVESHEGRHRSRALYEEGVKEMPVNIFNNPMKARPLPTKLPTIPEHSNNPLGIQFVNRGEQAIKKMKHGPRPVSARIQMARERLGVIHTAYEFKDDDMSKIEKDYLSNIDNKTSNRMHRIMKLDKELPPSKETKYDSARSKAENEYISTGKPIRPDKRSRVGPRYVKPPKGEKGELFEPGISDEDAKDLQKTLGIKGKALKDLKAGSWLTPARVKDNYYDVNVNVEDRGKIDYEPLNVVTYDRETRELMSKLRQRIEVI